MMADLYQTMIGLKKDDKYSVPDIILEEIWQRLCEEEKVVKVFYGGNVTDIDKWLEYVKDENNHFVFIVNTKEKRVCCVAWINKITSSTTGSHFFVLGPYHADITKPVLQYWGAIFLKKVLIGVIPTTNKEAIKLAKSVGYTELGQIPNGAYLAYENDYVASSILYLDLREIKNGLNR